MKTVRTDYRSQLMNFVAGLPIADLDRKNRLVTISAPEEDDKYTDFNRKLCAEFAVTVWRRALLEKPGMVPGMVEELGLHAALKADTKREVLVMDFFGCSEMNSTELVVLSKN